MDTRLKAKIVKSLLVTFSALILSAIVSASDTKISRQEVLHTFQQYIALNADFVSSVESGKGKSGKSYKDLRKEAEAYAEGPFHDALSRAEEIVCETGDKEVLARLFRVIISTSNSADESPASTLGGIFVCQPAAVEKEIARLNFEDRKQIYDSLEFGFENVATTKPKDDKSITTLRKRIAAMKPSDTK